MILVSGRSVVSVWNGLSSTLPLRIAERRSLIGKSGLVMLVGSENVGPAMSTRFALRSHRQPGELGGRQLGVCWLRNRGCVRAAHASGGPALCARHREDCEDKPQGQSPSPDGSAPMLSELSHGFSFLTETSSPTVVIAHER